MSILTQRSPHVRFLATFGALFALLMLRSCIFGFTYYPQLDDYIQYHNYLKCEDFAQLCQRVGLLASRPLAGVADYFLWGRLFSVMIVGVAIVSAMYAFCTLQMQSLLGRYFKVGPLFPVVMCLLPLGMEGLYWMSASTRIVAGLFFGCLAANCFAKWLDTGKLHWALLYLPLQLLPFGFYEQSAILSMTLVLGMAILEFRKNPRRALLAVWAIVSMGLYFLLTKLLAGDGGVYGSRTELALPVSRYYFDTFLPEVLRQMYSAFLRGGFFTFVKGFLRGLPLVLTVSKLPWLLCVLLCCGVLYVFRMPVSSPLSSGSKTYGSLLSLITGFLLFLAPISLFFLLANPWFSLRGTVTSFAGIALIVDTLAQMTLGRLKKGPALCAALSAGLAALFVIACASETKDYRDTHEHDQYVASLILEEAENLPRDAKIGILNLSPTAVEDQNFMYHEHITGCTESEWALSGLLTSRVGEGHLSVSPLPAPIMYRAWNCETRRPEKFDRLYYYDGTVLHAVTLEQTGERDFLVCDQNGPFARIWEDEARVGYFELLPSGQSD